MSAQNKIQALYLAEDIRREAYELERIARLRQMTEKIEWLRSGYYILALPVSLVISAVVCLVLGYVDFLPSTKQACFFMGVMIMVIVYLLTGLVLEKSIFRDRLYDKACEMRNLLAIDRSYRETLERLKQDDPALAKRICRMKFVTGEN